MDSGTQDTNTGHHHQLGRQLTLTSTGTGPSAAPAATPPRHFCSRVPCEIMGMMQTLGLSIPRWPSQQPATTRRPGCRVGSKAGVGILPPCTTASLHTREPTHTASHPPTSAWQALQRQGVLSDMK